jgi:hypothetical protein
MLTSSNRQRQITSSAFISTGCWILLWMSTADKIRGYASNVRKLFAYTKLRLVADVSCFVRAGWFAPHCCEIIQTNKLYLADSTRIHYVIHILAIMNLPVIYRTIRWHNHIIFIVHIRNQMFDSNIFKVHSSIIIHIDDLIRLIPIWSVFFINNY